MSRLTTYNTYGCKKTATHHINSCADEFIEIASGMDGKWVFGTAINKLAEYEDINLTPQEIVEMRADATALFKENKQLRKENEELKNQQIKLTVEKLEELKHYNHPTNTLCLPSCWVIDKVEKMINELKGEKL